jgi:transcriptional regulator with PAS, ATPase and Fis domain
MKVFSPSETSLLKNISKLAYINPFLPDRFKIEKKILGKDYVHEAEAWHIGLHALGTRKNVQRLHEKLSALSIALQKKVIMLKGIETEEAELYEDCVLFDLYYQCIEFFEPAIECENLIESDQIIAKGYEKYSELFDFFFSHSSFKDNVQKDKSHLYACFWQLRRAFHFIFGSISGSSKASYNLRASIWESVFTYDMKRYRRSMYKHTMSIPTLITGPSGSGKELVARAVGLSLYIPFNHREGTFKVRFQDQFNAINLSAFSLSLIESELFGHSKGAFTGALQDKKGWFELGSEQSALFIDEIGDLHSTIQVKLLRTLQARSFHRIGSHQERKLQGKVIFATHKDLAVEMIEGKFRQDFYYRICADTISTPYLKDILAENSENLQNTVMYILSKMFSDEEAVKLSNEITLWITKTLGLTYNWPGNFRECEQCIRNYLLRKNYKPVDVKQKSNNWVESCVDQELSLDELTKVYVNAMFEKIGNFEEVARKLHVDRRTIKSKLT